MTEQKIIFSKTRQISVEDLKIGDWFVYEGNLLKLLEVCHEEYGGGIRQIEVFDFNDDYDTIYLHEGELPNPISKVGNITIVAQDISHSVQECGDFYVPNVKD